MMAQSTDQLIERLKAAGRCRSDIRQLAEEWSGADASRYDALAEILSEEEEGKTLGILLNVAAANEIKMDPQLLADAFRAVDTLPDVTYPYRYQDEKAIGPLFETALYEDISWERQSLAARLAAELAVKFDQPRHPVKKVIWAVSKEVFSETASLMLDIALDLIEHEDGFKTDHLWMIEQDLFKELPKERPPVVIGGDYTVRRPVPKLGRNEPCHCGSGKKYKKCCYGKDQELLRDASSYEGVTRSQLRSEPSIVEDTAPIEEMRMQDLKKLLPGTLNNDQLVAAYQRAEATGLLELAFDMLLELKERPGENDLALIHMKDLFDSALSARDENLAEELAEHIPDEDRYDSEADRLHHQLLENSAKYSDLEDLCKKALTKKEEDHAYLLLELSYALEALLPGMSIVFGRAAIVSEPQRCFDNEALFDSIEKNRILLDLEPWGDPIEEYLDWTIEKGNEQSLGEDKDREIEALREQLEEAKGKALFASKDLRKKELELADLENKLKKVSSAAPEIPLKQPEAPQYPGSQQLNGLRRKIENLKDEIRSQQGARQQLRKQLQEANRRITSQEEREKEPAEAPAAPEDAVPAGAVPKKVQIPEFSDSFRKSCENLPQAVAGKALQAAAGFAARDDSVLRQASPLERLPGYFRIRVGIHYRLLLRQSPGEGLQILDIIPRQNLETWIRQQAG